MAKVLAIVVTYNAMQWMDRCLPSLAASSVPVDIMVVDNGSTDGTREYVRARFPEAVLVCKDDNPGFGAANNEGIRLALARGYDFVYLLNQDAWVLEDTIAKLVEAWTPEFGILSPMQMSGKGEEMDRRFSVKCGRFISQAGSGRKVVKVPFVMAAHWLVSRDALETVGGFSPAFRQYGEDDNWIDRMHFHGLSAGVVPSAAAVHDRADRKLSKDRRMRLKCISAIVKISDPSHGFRFRSVLEPLELLGMSLKNLSAVPLAYLPGFVKRYPELRELRAASMKKGAFL